MSLGRKNFKNTVHQSTLQKKTVQRRFSTGQLGKGNSDKMCLQPTQEGAECLWCSDAVLLHWRHVDFFFFNILCVCVCVCALICRLLQLLILFVCLLLVAGSDGSGFPAALHWYFCYVSYYLSNQFMVNRIKFFFSSLKKTSFNRS